MKRIWPITVAALALVLLCVTPTFAGAPPLADADRVVTLDADNPVTSAVPLEAELAGDVVAAVPARFALTEAALLSARWEAGSLREGERERMGAPEPLLGRLVGLFAYDDSCRRWSRFPALE